MDLGSIDLEQKACDNDCKSQSSKLIKKSFSGIQSSENIYFRHFDFFKQRSGHLKYICLSDIFTSSRM